MLEAFAAALRIPDAERNTLRLAAGFAPRPGAGSLAMTDRGSVRAAIEHVKKAYSNLPLLVKDRIWDIVDANECATELFAAALGGKALTGLRNVNVLELVFAPGLLRDCLDNWEEVADATVLRVQREVGLANRDPAFQEVIGRVASMPGFAARWNSPASTSSDRPSTRYVFRLPGGSRAYDSILMSLGAPYETLLNGIRFDTFHRVEDS